jgi:hypothetical protein
MILRILYACVVYTLPQRKTHSLGLRPTQPPPPTSHTRHRRRPATVLPIWRRFTPKPPNGTRPLTTTAIPPRSGESEKWTNNKAVVAIWHTITSRAAHPTYDAIATPSIQKGGLPTSAGRIHYVIIVPTLLKIQDAHCNPLSANNPHRRTSGPAEITLETAPHVINIRRHNHQTVPIPDHKSTAPRRPSSLRPLQTTTTS